MRIAVRFNGDVAILSLSGKFLAGSDGPYLRQKVKDLMDAGTKKLMIDFSDVPYIDSTGLGFLAGARVTAQNAGRANCPGQYQSPRTQDFGRCEPDPVLCACGQ